MGAVTILFRNSRRNMDHLTTHSHASHILMFLGHKHQRNIYCCYCFRARIGVLVLCHVERAVVFVEATDSDIMSLTYVRIIPTTGRCNVKGEALGVQSNVLFHKVTC